ncbi:hypothetical protein BDY19DRAFT_910800 [Irpex rosettiformis]|uniref:Uncharacterized protein n=1 Tax=Irpex rosettiformis TaxID=378272 RepID=A0ACB8TME0_9APHY|nr:hypothetical protein BDY19DRAFT_910800 [Irpex rosettiformis]
MTTAMDSTTPQCYKLSHEKENPFGGRYLDWSLDDSKVTHSYCYHNEDSLLTDSTPEVVCKRLSAGPPARHAHASGSLRLGGLKFNNKYSEGDRQQDALRDNSNIEDCDIARGVVPCFTVNSNAEDHPRVLIFKLDVPKVKNGIHSKIDPSKGEGREEHIEREPYLLTELVASRSTVPPR